MRVEHVVGRISVEAQGPSHSVPALCEALAECGCDIVLHVAGRERPDHKFGFRVVGHRFWRGPKTILFSPSMQRALRDAAASAEILHSHGLWTLPTIYPGFAIRNTRCRLVTSPRGTLAPWALKRTRFLKHLLWALLQGPATRRSACFHATSEQELREIRAMGLRAPVTVIPNGVTIPENFAAARDDGSARRLLFLSRLHPIKGVDNLLTAWRTIQRDYPDWTLSIVGPDVDGYLEKMKELASALGCERVGFDGEAYGAEKADAFRRADLFVLPSHSENFGLVVAEALSFGVPAIASKGAPWKGLVTNRCGWWVDIGAEPLAECLREALSTRPADLRERGLKGRAWMERDFSWKIVGQKMAATYEWLLGGGAPPPWVERPS